MLTECTVTSVDDGTESATFTLDQCKRILVGILIQRIVIPRCEKENDRLVIRLVASDTANNYLLIVSSYGQKMLLPKAFERVEIAPSSHA
jgi:hypothetical protein